MSTGTIPDINGDPLVVELPNSNGRQDAAASRPVALATEDNAAVVAIGTKLGEVQASPTANTVLDRLKTIATSLAGTLTISLPSGAATAANQASELTLVGAVTETAPGSDTASSGLNGRLQRIAQRLTSLIGLIPASLGTKAAASSLAVTLSDEDKAILDEEVANLPAPFPHDTRGTGSGNVGDTTTSAQILAANAARIGGAIVNDSTAHLYLLMSSGTASATNYDYFVPGSVDGVPYTFEIPPGWTGPIHGIWASDAGGSARAHEREA